MTRQGINYNRVSHEEQLLYHIWKGMIYRCHGNAACQPYYESYQGRGIKVCDEWRQSFHAFRDWALASGYEHGLTLDREENDLHYHPDNCRWSTRTVQQRNQRRTVMIEIAGETRPLQEWCEIYQAPYRPVYYRIFQARKKHEPLAVLQAWEGLR